MVFSKARWNYQTSLTMSFTLNQVQTTSKAKKNIILSSTKPQMLNILIHTAKTSWISARKPRDGWRKLGVYPRRILMSLSKWFHSVIEGQLTLMKSSSAKFICGWVEVIEFIHQASISQNIETLQKANFLVLPMFWHNCCNAVTIFLASVLMRGILPPENI